MQLNKKAAIKIIAAFLLFQNNLINGVPLAHSDQLYYLNHL
jgi:hypothetical protein